MFHFDLWSDLVLVYVGSKARLAKNIVPIIQIYADKSDTYIEPFVGGANIIDKVVHKNKIGSDVNKYLIALLQKAQTDVDAIPDWISLEEYYTVKKHPEQYEDWYIGLVSIVCSFKSKIWGGYAKETIDGRNHVEEHIRNLKKQSVRLGGIEFRHCDYMLYEGVENATIYCDPPYANTLGYNTQFDHEEFLCWCKNTAKHNYVLLSERFCPKGFKTLFETQNRNGMLFNEKQIKFVDGLYICEE